VFGHRGLYKRFFREAMGYVTADEDAVDQLGEAAPLHAMFHKRIVAVSIVFGILGGLIGLGFAISGLLWPHPGHEDDQKMLLLAPMMAGAAGLLFGAAVACLFAPREFLTGPIGSKWMTLIGTKNVLAARLVCLMVAMIPVGFVIAVIYVEARRK
jgi:hypothetical protein